jgi:hypothetical protein
MIPKDAGRRHHGLWVANLKGKKRSGEALSL